MQRTPSGPQTRRRHTHHRRTHLARWTLVCLALSMLAPGGCRGDAHGDAQEEKAEAASTAMGVEAIDAFIASQNIDKTKTGWKTRLPRPPKVNFDPNKEYYWHLDTNVGSIKVRLMPDVAPMHVSSTIYLARLGFYDGTKFHRVIPEFMAQGGDPTGTGRGGPGYKYAGEFSGKAKHDKAGILSMANSGPRTDGSQFFLTFKETPHLNGRHTVFGEVTEGMATVKRLEARGSRGRGVPTEPLEIRVSTILVE